MSSKPKDEDVGAEDNVLNAPEARSAIGIDDEGAREGRHGESVHSPDTFQTDGEERPRSSFEAGNHAAFNGYSDVVRSTIESDEHDLESLDFGQFKTGSDSAEGSLSIPDDTPSIQGSILSSPGSSAIGSPAPSTARISPSPSLRPFDRRFQSRLSPSPLGTPRSISPAFLASHSRQASLSSQLLPDHDTDDTTSGPWETVRWTKLKGITGQVFSEVGKRKFGTPTYIAVSACIALGTTKGIILIFDYHQNLKSVIGVGTKAVECGRITSLAISADHSTVAGGHANGSIFTWELARSARPFLHIPPLHGSQLTPRRADGHLLDVAILHVGFLGTRHTALVSADDRGMAFSHLATRGMGAVGRSVKTTRILGRYPESSSAAQSRPRKPSSLLAFSPLPLGNVEQATDNLGLVAMLTPYLLVIVSTTPVAQTQYKSSRSKEVNAHSVMCGSLAWFPSVKLRVKDPITRESTSRAKLAYAWADVLTILELHTAIDEGASDRDRPPNLDFRPRSRWRSEEAIVAIQWLSRSVIAVLTITQRLIILEDPSLHQTGMVDLIHKQIYHIDIFSRQLQPLVEQLDGENSAMHGVVADAFYMSVKAYKGRLFVLESASVSVGTLSNWADRLVALMEDGDFIAAIKLATSYYKGDSDNATIDLPEDGSSRHAIVQEKLLDMMNASMRYVFSQNRATAHKQQDSDFVAELVKACFWACLSMEQYDFLFEEIFETYQEHSYANIFLETLESYILDGQIRSIPPTVMKNLVQNFAGQGLESRIEEIICRVDPATLDLNQVLELCKKHALYDALIYVWNRAMSDYVTPLIELLTLLKASKKLASSDINGSLHISKIFPYLSYSLTGRVYPTGEVLAEVDAVQARTEIYAFLFSGQIIMWPRDYGEPFFTKQDGNPEPPFPYLRMILEFDTPSFMSVLNEAFEDHFLNGDPEKPPEKRVSNGFDGLKGASALAINRQYIISILMEVMGSNGFSPEDRVYLDMFIARNLPKYPQFILLPGTALQNVIKELCSYSSQVVAEDCQLSIEYLLSIYHPSDIESLLPLLREAGFYRVLKSIHRSERQFADLIQAYFDDTEDQDGVFDCIEQCLRPKSGLTEKQIRDVRSIIRLHGRDLLDIDVVKTAKCINTFAPDLNGDIVKISESDPRTQYLYLTAILEPESNQEGIQKPDHTFLEKYVELMCEFDSSHVAEFVGTLQPGDLELDKVLPAMESGGVIDAAVIIMVREGQARSAMDRLLAHLESLEAALLGMLGMVEDSPGSSAAGPAIQDVLSAIDKYTKVGVWLCRTQMETVSKTKLASRNSKTSSMQKDLSTEELLWLDLIDSIVRIAEAIAGSSRRSISDANTRKTGESRQLPDAVSSIREIVQQTFTILLNSTAISHGKSAINSDNLSFLRILRAFLVRASLASPTLSDLRGVLASIFSAYSNEESLLSLSNKLLDKDLFVQVAEASRLRQKGWRPASQICEICGKRTWGPGVGGNIWGAWQQKRKEEKKKLLLKSTARKNDPDAPRERGKGKLSTERNDSPSNLRQQDALDSTNEFASGEDSERASPMTENAGRLVVFTCRHVCHERCLQKLPNEQQVHEPYMFKCPSCT